jgi:hypothetical protein
MEQLQEWDFDSLFDDFTLCASPSCLSCIADAFELIHATTLQMESTLLL